MTTTETYEIDVCTDCLMFLANGDVPEDNPHNWSPDDIDRQWPQRPGERTWIALGDSEQHFSWRRCEGCGSSLGGDRHPATVFVESKG